MPASGCPGTARPPGASRCADRAWPGPTLRRMTRSSTRWISSIDLENLAVGHPKVAEAAVIGVKHPKWDERPLLVVVLRKDQSATRDEILKFMCGTVAN